MLSALKKLLGIRQPKKNSEPPLFSGSAYFSNRVPIAFSEKWVQHGGELSSGTTLDVRARFFFATDPLEPWVTKLFAKSVMVIHAGWIAHCVDAAFQVPIAEYILDDKFVPGYPYKLTDYFSPPIYVPLSEPGPTDVEPDECRSMSIQTSDTPSTPTSSMPRKRTREQAYFDSPSGSLVFSGFDKDGMPRRPRKQRKLRFDPSFSPDGGRSNREMVRCPDLYWLRDRASRDDVDMNQGHEQDKEAGVLRGPNSTTTLWSPDTPEKPLALEGLSETYRHFSHLSQPTHVSSPAISVDKREGVPPVRTIDFTNLPPRTRRWRFPDAEGKKPGDKGTILSVVKSAEPKVKTPKKITFAEHARVCVYDVSPRSDAKGATVTPAQQCSSEGPIGGPEVDGKTRASTDEVKAPKGPTAEATKILATCTDSLKMGDDPTKLVGEDQSENDTRTITMEEVLTKRRHLLESTARNGADDGQLLTLFEPQKTFEGMPFHVVW